MTIPYQFKNWLTKKLGDPFSGNFQAGGTKGIVKKLRYEIFYISQSIFLDQNEGTSFVELELFRTEKKSYIKKQSSNFVTIFDVRPEGLTYEKNEKLFVQKVNFEMDRSQDEFI